MRSGPRRVKPSTEAAIHWRATAACRGTAAADGQTPCEPSRPKPKIHGRVRPCYLCVEPTPASRWLCRHARTTVAGTISLPIPSFFGLMPKAKPIN